MIQDYAVLGDGRSAALVSRGGSVDWLCWPDFDSPSIFGALLDPQAGFWSLRPAGEVRVERRYLPRTNVLETRFLGDAGVLAVTDFMAVADGPGRALRPEAELVRLVRCEAGEVDVEMACEPRPRYGSRIPRIVDARGLGFRAELDVGLLTLRTDLPARLAGPGRVEARARLRAGQGAWASLSLAREGPAVLRESCADVLRDAVAAWERWARAFRYDGPWRDAVLRSALALKLLVYAPSGAIVAAPTTSLPERPGGGLNWDYRYAWLRDASLTVRAFLGAGFRDEATAFTSWLLHATALTRPALRILYDVYGREPGRERVLDGLCGYAGSRPVRVGNAARDQLQLDVYGEVVTAVAQEVEEGVALDGDTRRLLKDLGGYVARHWDQPDDGIWEPRSGRRPHTHSRLLSWAALDRLIELQRKGHLGSGEVALWRREREKIRREIEEGAWNPDVGSYLSEIAGGGEDASLLLIPWYGFEDAGSARMRSTYRRIRGRLGAGRSLLYRYRTEDSPGEGAFGIASFWGVEYLALGGGELEEAERAFEELLGFANDVGLFAEEIDPATGAALGNFPQGFTHVGLINAALSIERRRRGEPSPKRELRPAGRRGP